MASLQKINWKAVSEEWGTKNNSILALIDCARRNVVELKIRRAYVMEQNKKKRLQFSVALLAGVLLFGSGMKVGAATAEPGSVGDPLITQSYLELRLSQFGAGYECITLNKGATLELPQGAQVVLYTGSAKVKGSLIDMTGGVLAASGTVAERYHTYLAPADGSGLTATAACVVFINGSR